MPSLVIKTSSSANELQAIVMDPPNTMSTKALRLSRHELDDMKTALETMVNVFETKFRELEELDIDRAKSSDVETPLKNEERRDDLFIFRKYSG